MGAQFRGGQRGEGQAFGNRDGRQRCGHVVRERMAVLVLFRYSSAPSNRPAEPPEETP